MIILMGLAGSGKSTQGKRLAERLEGVWLSAGQVLRDTPDEAVHELQRKGELVPDTITIPLMAEAMAAVEQDGKEAVIDGYPRTIDQAEWMAENVSEQIKAAIIIKVPKEELYARMALRGRADDMDRAAIDERFRIVEQNICSVQEILERKGVKFYEIDGVGTEDEVAERLWQVVEGVTK